MDKKKRAYLACPHCGTRIFIYNHQGACGIRIAHETVLRVGVARWRRLVQEAVNRRMRNAKL